MAIDKYPENLIGPQQNDNMPLFATTAPYIAGLVWPIAIGSYGVFLKYTCIRQHGFPSFTISNLNGGKIGFFRA